MSTQDTLTAVDETPRVRLNETIDGQPIDEQMEATKRVRNVKPENSQVKTRRDPYLWGLYVVLLVVSIVELFSASSAEVKSSNVYAPLIRHVVFLGLGLLLVIGLENLHYKWFRKYAFPMAVISLILLIWSSFFGANINGAQRAIMIAGITIQPPEIVKVTCILLLATILAKRQISGGVSLRGVVEAATVVIIFAGLTFKDGLTNTLLLMCTSLCMFLIGGMKWRYVGIIVAIYLTGGGLMYYMKKADAEAQAFEQTERTGTVNRAKTQENRITDWLSGVHPGDPITDTNRQAIYARFAQAKGGLVGPGPGNSVESARLPLAFSDYIFSIIVEDTGFVGAILLMIIYLSIIARAGRVASKCSRAFPALLILGCAVVIVFQAMVHMMIVSGVGPVTGQPLPFISKGGTSVLIMSVAMGMMMSVSRWAVRGNSKNAIKQEENELPEDIQAANPTQINS